MTLLQRALGSRSPGRSYCLDDSRQCPWLGRRDPDDCLLCANIFLLYRLLGGRRGG